MDSSKISKLSMDFLAKVHIPSENTADLIIEHIQLMESYNFKIPEFDEAFGWLNVESKLTFSNNLDKKLCVLDFFTYCCINCMHIIPDLHDLEKRYTSDDGLVVLGIHSAKFENEKATSNILNALLRYDINHPVVNDCNAVYWKTLGIQCWPTLVIVSPEGKILLYLVGEGHRDILFKYVEVAISYYANKNLISSHKLPIKPAKENLKKDILQFPGKIAVYENMIAISNTGEHQILVVSLEGVLMHRIGGNVSGFIDGTFDVCRFNNPQGLTWHGSSTIFVADTDNHSIRKIDLEEEEVSTITGTGKQGNDKEGGKSGVLQEISSPWDVLVSSSPGKDASTDKKNCLYIAAAGTHQIWCYFLEKGSWIRNSTQDAGTCVRFAGSGNEENRNNSYPHKASFAQPSGLTLAVLKEEKYLFIADSESSSVRRIELKSGAVKSCVGGERDPTNLFAYGDIDGKGVDAKLQHPLAVCFDEDDGIIYVADSYNHKIKQVNPSTLECTTLCGDGQAGCADGEFASSRFNEPGGLSMNGKKLYVADTNNHKIRVIDLNQREVTSMSLIESSGDAEDKTDYVQPDTNQHTHHILESKRNLNEKNVLKIFLDFDRGLHINSEAKSRAKLTFMKAEKNEMIASETKYITVDPTVIELQPWSCDIEIKVDLVIYLCSEDNACYMKQYNNKLTILHDAQVDINEDIELRQKISL